jgi:branched-chain amino acid transport system permease protein
MVLIVYLFVERVLTSPFGRLLKAMRENEDVVRAFGKDILMLRIKTAALGSGIAALAGALHFLTSSKREKCAVCKWFKRSET